MDKHEIFCVWTGEVFEPHRKAQLDKVEEAFGAGEIVVVTVEAERSWRSHKHQFASIRDLWANLPESMSEMPYAKSAETLRKHALIVTGHADCETIDAGSKAAAERVGAYVGSLAGRAHGYALTKISGRVVRCYTPHSQSVRAMGAQTFQKSKTDVLEWIEGLIGAHRGEAA